MDDLAPPFWKTKTLEQMTREEWESLCDGCGRCCLVKLEDEDNGEVYTTRLSCACSNVRSCRCKDYANRFSKMPDCLEIDVKQGARTDVAAEDVRLPRRRRGPRPGVVAPARFRNAGDGASSRNFRPQLRHERTPREGRELLALHHPGFGGWGVAVVNVRLDHLRPTSWPA